MNLPKLVKLSFLLASVGVAISLVSIFLPWVFGLAITDDRWQAAGTISSALASIFGMLISSVALFAYLQREEVGQTQSDYAYQQKLRLEQAIHQYSFFYERIIKAKSKSGGSITGSVANYTFLIMPSITHLYEILNDASRSDLYEALGSIDIKQNDGLETNGGIELVYLRFHIKRLLEEDTININDSILRTNVANLIIALQQVNKDNIYSLIHKPLNKAPFEFMIESNRKETTN